MKYWIGLIVMVLLSGLFVVGMLKASHVIADNMNKEMEANHDPS